MGECAQGGYGERTSYAVVLDICKTNSVQMLDVRYVVAALAQII